MNSLQFTDYDTTTVRRQMETARETVRPTIPKKFNDLGSIIKGYEPVADYFRGMAVDTVDDKAALIFAANGLLDPLKKCNQLFGDGTFKVVYCNCRFQNFL